jgi:Effector Associated Constant Component 1
MSEMTDRGENGGSRLGVQVGLGPDDEPEAVAEATLQLRRELLELDVDSVELARAGAPPPGTRAVDFIALGSLVVTVANSGLLNGVVAAIRSWLAGRPQRSIKLELDGDVLELTGVSSEEQRRLADAWLRRHARR